MGLGLRASGFLVSGSGELRGFQSLGFRVLRLLKGFLRFGNLPAFGAGF